MSTDNNMLKLYSKRILALAADVPFAERLASPDATARKRSPLCGSTVTVDLMISEGRIAAYGQDVKACALGQAAASVVGKNIIGCTFDDVQSAQSQLTDMLKADGPPPKAPFEGLEALLPARDFKNRHASILLTLDAIIAAFEDVSATA